MLKQYKILSSGSQQWFPNVLASNSKYFFYCSTLAIYVHRIADCRLDKLLSVHDRTISCLCTNPQDEDQLATCGIDKKISIWDVTREISTASIKVEKNPVAMDWNPFANELVFALEDGRVNLWNPETGKVRPIFHRPGVKVRNIVFNPQVKGLFICGNSDGSIFHCNLETNETIFIEAEQHTGVSIVNMKWDLLSSYYLIVAYKNGDISFWDMEQKKEHHCFDRQGAGIRGISWIEWQPGNFVTVNSRAGTIRVWNVSQTQPLEIVRVSEVGFQGIHFMEGTEKILCSFTDGSVGVFDFGKKRLEYRSKAAHKETVFASRFCPNDEAVLATASFDSTVKIWNTDDMECIQTLVGQSGIIYSVSWAPGDTSQIASACSKGDVAIWDTKEGKMIKQSKIHEGPAYCVAWNKINHSKIATVGSDGNLVIMNPQGVVSRRYPHPKCQLYGCSWCLTDPEYIAIGGSSQKVIIYNTSSGSPSVPVCQLKSHTAKIFAIEWHPTLSHVFASSSDDKTVRIWRLEKDFSTGRCLQVLRGHTHNTRNLVWHPEFSNIIFSGSWDSTIRVWDASNGECLSVANEHHADVYGLTMHPRRPFVLVSTSRDTTLRCWLMDGQVAAARMQVLLNESMSPIVGSIEDAKKALFGADKTQKWKMCGSASEMQMKRFAGARSMLDRMKIIFDFFFDADGLVDFWSLLTFVLERQGKSGSDTKISAERMKKLLHATSVSPALITQANELYETLKQRGGVGLRSGLPKTDVLSKCADLYLYGGDLKRHCEVLVEKGDWKRALALAPGVSIEFWKKIMEKQAAQLRDQENKEALPLLLASGNVESAVELCLEQNRLQSAQLLLQSAEKKKQDALAEARKKEIENEEVKEEDGTSKNEDKKEVIDVEVKIKKTTKKLKKIKISEKEDIIDVSDSELWSSLRQIASNMAKHAFHLGKPVRAACFALAVDDTSAALQWLSRGGEIELAYALARILRLQGIDPLLVALARKCEAIPDALGASLALQVLQQTTDSVLEVSLLAYRFLCRGNDIVFKMAELRTPESFLQSIGYLERQGDRFEKARACLIGGETENALNCIIVKLQEIFTKPTWDWKEAMKYNRLLSCCPLDKLPCRLRDEGLTWALFLALHSAMARGFLRVVPMLASNFRNLVHRNGFRLGVSVPATLLTVAQSLATANPAAATDIIKRLRLLPSIDTDILRRAKLLIDSIASYDWEGDDELTAVHRQHANDIITVSESLPAMQQQCKISFLTGKPIRGRTIFLEDDVSCLSESDALMWTSVCSFSPLNTGAWLSI